MSVTITFAITVIFFSGQVQFNLFFGKLSAFARKGYIVKLNKRNAEYDEDAIDVKAQDLDYSFC